MFSLHSFQSFGDRSAMAINIKQCQDPPTKSIRPVISNGIDHHHTRNTNGITIAKKRPLNGNGETAPSAPERRTSSARLNGDYDYLPLPELPHIVNIAHFLTVNTSFYTYF